MTDFPLVMVWWHDSRRPASEWLRLSDFVPESICHCCSVGYVVYEDGKQLALAPTIADANSDDPQISGTIQIPIECIVKRQIVKSSAFS